MDHKEFMWLAITFNNLFVSRMEITRFMLYNEMFICHSSWLLVVYHSLISWTIWFWLWRLNYIILDESIAITSATPLKSAQLHAHCTDDKLLVCLLMHCYVNYFFFYMYVFALKILNWHHNLVLVVAPKVWLFLLHNVFCLFCCRR